MAEVEKDEVREHRILMDIIVDAYDEEEQAMGWYYYLEENMDFPFLAQCRKAVTRSPLLEGEQVEVIHMANENECLHDMIVEIQWQGRTIGVPLLQLQPLNVDEQIREAIEDWQYWNAQGYRL
jgi:hypothetical protein